MTRPRYLLPVAAGLLLLLVLVLQQAPARLLAPALSERGVVASGFSGTLWRGGVASLALPVSGRYLQLGRVQWRVSPWSLLWLRPELNLESRWGAQRGRAELSASAWGGVLLHELDLVLDAGLSRLWLPVELRGQLELNGRELGWSESAIRSGGGSLVWRQAQWIGYRDAQRLGDYVLEFQVVGEQRLAGRVSSLSGPVSAAGQLIVDGRNYRADLQLRTDGPLSSEFLSALELVAAPTSQGYHLSFSADL